MSRFTLVNENGGTLVYGFSDEFKYFLEVWARDEDSGESYLHKEYFIPGDHLAERVAQENFRLPDDHRTAAMLGLPFGELPAEFEECDWGYEPDPEAVLRDASLLAASLGTTLVTPVVWEPQIDGDEYAHVTCADGTKLFGVIDAKDNCETWSISRQ